MPQEIAVVLADLLAPFILFFVLGIITVLVKSDLEIPPEITRFLAIFLLISIGLEGGIEAVEGVLAHLGLLLVIVVVALLGIIISSSTTLFNAIVFKRIVGFKTADAWATAGLYGAVSTVTFMVAIGIADAAQAVAAAEAEAAGLPVPLIWGGWMVAANVFLDAPGVIAAIVFGRMALTREKSGTNVKIERKVLLRDAVFGWAIWLMLCGMFVGVLGQLFSPERTQDVMAFFDDMFPGILCIYLVEMGMMAARRFGELKAYGKKLVRAVLAAWILPQIWAGVAALFMAGINLIAPGAMGWGCAFVFVAMAGSASYISAPPAMRAAIPEANPSVYLPMSLALTFPFNILISLPLIWAPLCMFLWGL